MPVVPGERMRMLVAMKVSRRWFDIVCWGTPFWSGGNFAYLKNVEETESSGQGHFPNPKASDSRIRACWPP